MRSLGLRGMRWPWVSRRRLEATERALEHAARHHSALVERLDGVIELLRDRLPAPERAPTGSEHFQFMPAWSGSEVKNEPALPGSTETVPVQGAQAVAVLDPGPNLPAETLRRVSQVVAAAESRKERDRQIVAECRKGTKSHAEIGREFGLSAARIAQIATAAGLPHRPSGRQRKGRG